MGSLTCTYEHSLNVCVVGSLNDVQNCNVGDTINAVEDVQYYAEIPLERCMIFNSVEGNHKHFGYYLNNASDFPPQY